jgi:alginate O-acetyltransferase complex protein AlgI
LGQKFCDTWPAGTVNGTACTNTPPGRANSCAFAAGVRLRSSSVAVPVLLVASYVFYGYGDHFAVLLPTGSTAFNYVIGQAIAWAMRRGEGTLGRLLLGIGICGDLALLGYFKYADHLTVAQWPIPVIALPIGIFFYTFTQIAFLVDTFRGAAATLRATDYSLHLVAGPIIHQPRR